MGLAGLIQFKVCDFEFYTIFKRFHHMKMHGCIEHGIEQKIKFSGKITTSDLIQCDEFDLCSQTNSCSFNDVMERLIHIMLYCHGLVMCLNTTYKHTFYI